MDGCAHVASSSIMLALPTSLASCLLAMPLEHTADHHAFLSVMLRSVLQARRFPEGSDVKLFYEVGLQQLLICFVVVVLISGAAQVFVTVIMVLPSGRMTHQEACQQA